MVVHIYYYIILNKFVIFNRWSSLADMLGRFLKIRTAVQKSLIDLCSDINFSEEEFKSLDDIYSTLQPIKTAVEMLGSRKMTLLSADATLKFLLKKLGQLKSPISKQLINALRRRISDRRTDLFGVLQFLHNPNSACAVDEEADTFRVTKRTQIQNIIKDLIQQLYPSVPAVQTGPVVPEPVPVAVPVSDPPLDIKGQFMEAVAKAQKISSARAEADTIINMNSTLMKKMSLFENGGVRGKYLELAYNALLSIPPTSIESKCVHGSTTIHWTHCASCERISLIIKFK